MNIDQRLTRVIHHFFLKSKWLSYLAVFLAAHVLWILVGFGFAFLFQLPVTGGDISLAVCRICAFLLIPVILLPWSVSLFIAEIVKRPRPYRRQPPSIPPSEGGNTIHSQPLLRLLIETPSFPSEHATVAFAIAIFFSSEPLLFPLMITIATLVALGRIAVGVHYVSDVIVGALIGLIFGKAAHMAIMLLFVLLK